MKTIQYLIILICCFIIAACSVENEIFAQNALQSPFQSTEWVAEQSNTGVNIDRYLSGIEALGFSGAIIVSEGDVVVLRKGYGYANRETRQPFTPSTVQSNGSITKQMTAAAILLLESRNQLSVEDSLAKFFHHVPQDKQSITIHQLFTHSSGLVGGVGGDGDPTEKQPYLDRLIVEPLEFDPGTGDKTIYL